MKVKKNIIYTVLVLIILLGAWYFFFSTPEYEMKITPKPILGNEEASLKIVEYSDLQCPYCARAHLLMKDILADYGDYVSYEFKHFPLTSIHPAAFKSAEAAECANDQGKFWEYVDLVFARQDTLSMNTLHTIANDLELDDSFFDYLESGAKEQFVAAEQRSGNAKSVTGTPTFFINGEKIDIAEFEVVLNNKLKEAGALEEASNVNAENDDERNTVAQGSQENGEENQETSMGEGSENAQSDNLTGDAQPVDLLGITR